MESPPTTPAPGIHFFATLPASLIKHWLPLLIALLLFGLIIIGLRSLFVRQRAAGVGSRYREQGLLALAGGIFLFVVVITAPISDNLRGQLLGLFGIVLSATIALSSTTVMGNLIAGFMLRVTSNLRAGDFIRVGEQFGRITEKGLLHIEIQTEDSDLSTIPNLSLVQQPFTLIRATGTIICADVSLGYDISRLRVEKALLSAASSAGLEDSFVQVRNLGDFSVVYRICGRLIDVRQIVSRRGRLRAAMLDELHEAGIEIVSPTFMNQRVLDRQQHFIPHQPAILERETDTPDIEELMFGKAERAQMAERLEKRLARIRQQMEALKKESSARGGEDQAVREEYERRIQHLQRRESQLEQLIATTLSEVDDER